MPFGWGHYTFAAGQRDWIGFGWGDDHGAIIAIPREFNGSTLGNYLALESIETQRHTDGSITYWMLIWNEGPNVASFELIIGGLA